MEWTPFARGCRNYIARLKRLLIDGVKVEITMCGSSWECRLIDPCGCNEQCLMVSPIGVRKVQNLMVFIQCIAPNCQIDNMWHPWQSAMVANIFAWSCKVSEHVVVNKEFQMLLGHLVRQKMEWNVSKTMDLVWLPSTYANEMKILYDKLLQYMKNHSHENALLLWMNELDDERNYVKSGVGVKRKADD